MTGRITIVGGGLAGCEAAWQLARRGIGVDLHEMRPRRGTEAHTGDRLAELVCSNSFRNATLETAVGLLKTTGKKGHQAAPRLRPRRSGPMKLVVWSRSTQTSVWKSGTRRATPWTR